MQKSAVLQGAVPYRTPARSWHAGRTGGAKARPASRMSDSRAFLNTRIDEIAVSDTDMPNVELAKGYEEFVTGLKRFYRMAHRRFVEPKKGTIPDKMCQLIERTERDLGEIGLELSVWKLEDYKELNFTLYRHVGIMDDVVYIFYLSPCDVLKGEMSSLYKRYIRYMGDCFGTNIVTDGSCNYYIDMILNMMLEDYYDEENEYNHEKKMIDFYQHGHGYNLFKEINELIVSPDELQYDLEAYRKRADGDELELVETMLEGMNVLPYMSIDRYDFNPLRDGFDVNDGYIENCSQIGFVYGRDDGLEELILDSINNDLNCGLVSIGWNKWLHLNNFTREDYDFVTSSNSKQQEFVDWTVRWYNIERKFDENGINRCIETEVKAD